MQPSLLAIETSTALCSVALRLGDGPVLERSEFGSTVHSAALLPMIQSLLAEADCTLGALDLIAVGKGPGSFTGLRIGIGVAQGLAYGARIPLFGATSLECLARQQMAMTPAGSVWTAIDARMNEVYWATFTGSDHPSGALSMMGR